MTVLSRVLAEQFLTRSMAESRRLISSGSIKVNKKKVDSDIDIPAGICEIEIGKHKRCTVIVD